MKEVDFEFAYSQLVSVFEKHNLEGTDIIPWIMVKTLRLPIKEFQSIKNINIEQFKFMLKAVKRYIKGQSLGKIFGYIEFYNLFFKVADGVFDPRKSTECLIDAIKLEGKVSKTSKILDLCSGSGCIAITCSLIFRCKTYGVDISTKALNVAKLNSCFYNSNTKFFRLDLRKDWTRVLKDKFDIIVSNPPYWDKNKIHNLSDAFVKNSPKHAYISENKGLEFYDIIIENAPNFLKKQGRIYLEMNEEQELYIVSKLENKFHNIKSYKDYRGITRVISAQLN